MANASYVTVRLDGLPEALQALAGFRKGVQRTQTRRAIDAGAGVLKQGAIRRVPTETNTLKKNLIVQTKQGKKDTSVYAKIGARKGVKVAVHDGKKGLKAVASWTRKKDKTLKTTGKKRLAKLQARGETITYRSPSRYLHLVEKGTRSHTVKAKNARFLARSGQVFGSSVQISAKPNPFLERTARSDGPAAVNKAKAKLKEGIEQERVKARSRSKA